MITSLDIRNYALIDELRVEFAEGLTIVTGETGAGKSIMLGGLGLIMGQRADTKALFDPARKCVVEAHFDVSGYELERFFEEYELDYEPEVVVRREIAPSGKTRAFVNDTPVKLAVLQALSRSLVDLHQQFDTLDIFDVSFQLRMLDALADNAKLLGAYAHGYRAYQADQRELRRLESEYERVRQESDFVAFQLGELDAADVHVGEGERLEQELKTLEAAEDIKRVLGGAGTQLVEHDQAIVSQLRDLMPGIEALRGVNESLEQVIDRLDGLVYELEDCGQSLVDIAEDTEFDPERIAEVQDRLSVIYKLQQKHGVATVEELIAVRDDYAGRQRSHGQLEKGMQSLRQSLDTQRRVLVERALELRERRAAVVEHFVEQVHARLGKLSMRNARLEIRFSPLAEPGPTGTDEVEFLFAANKGSRLLPIKGVASGGELSRLTLVTKSLVASSIRLPTLIFDEIDSGVSGDVALRMGEILRELSDEHQVVTITHSPQVASKADRHYYVYKEDSGERTATRVRELARVERVRALAVMLSSDPPSEAAVANAEGLIAAVG